MAAFKVLGPTNMPSKQVGLANWGVVEFKLLCGQYRVQHEIGGKKIPPLLNSSTIKRECFAFKLQAITVWLDKSFKDVSSMITWNHTLKIKYENLLVLVEIARVQCISTTSCERAFSVQNCIKTKQRNTTLTKKLERVLRVALEGPIEDYYDIINEVIGIWKNNTKFRYLFFRPERYLCGVVASKQEATNLLRFVHEMEIIVVMIIYTNLNSSTPQWLQFV